MHKQEDKWSPQESASTPLKCLQDGGGSGWVPQFGMGGCLSTPLTEVWPVLPPPPYSIQGGGADFGRGEFHGDRLVFQFGAEIFPRKIFFGAIWGTSCSLCTLSGGSSQVLLRCCRQSVCSSRPFILLSWE